MGAKVRGARELRSTLKKAGVDLTDLKDVNAAVAAMVTQAAAARAPRRTGRLAASGRGNRAVGRAVVTFGGARLRYAGPVHWGWPRRGIIAQPFASQAAQATEAQWTELYLSGVEKVLTDVHGA